MPEKVLTSGTPRTGTEASGAGTLLRPSFFFGGRGGAPSQKLRKANISFVNVCLSVRPHGTTRLPTGRISMKFYVGTFYENLSTKFEIFLNLLTAIGLSPGGSGYFTCKQNMKLVTNRFKSGGLHEKHVVATWNVGNRLSICL